MPASGLEAISKARTELREHEAALAASFDSVRRAKAKLEQARRLHRPAAVISDLTSAAKAAEEEHRSRLKGLNDAGRHLDGLLKPIRTSPDAKLATQERAVPMALLPVRIETRLKDGKLLVRIYPDQLHLHRHSGAITRAEAELARAYWHSAAAGEDEGEAWRSLVALTGANRARFLAARLHPDPAGAEPSVETVDAPVPARPEARLLPTRWCVTLIDSDGKTILRKWSKPVAERLAMSPAGDLLDSFGTAPDGELPLDPEARWLVDFKDALDRGMAIEIGPNEFGAQGLPGSVARLVVVGSDWTMTPDASAAALTEQLLAHSYTEGFALPAQGTATNRSNAPATSETAAIAAAAAAPSKPDDDLARTHRRTRPSIGSFRAGRFAGDGTRIRGDRSRLAHGALGKLLRLLSRAGPQSDRSRRRRRRHSPASARLRSSGGAASDHPSRSPALWGAACPGDARAHREDRRARRL